MAKKRVHYYRTEFMSNSGEILTQGETKELIIDFIEKQNKVFDPEIKVLDITDPSDDMRTILEVIQYDKDVFIGKLTKQKHSNSMVKHDYNTYATEPLLAIGKTDKDEGIGVYTYCLYDYDKKIFSIISGQSTPKEKHIVEYINARQNKYRCEMLPIPNQQSIMNIYGSEQPELTKMEVELPVLSLEVLNQVFDFESDSHLMELAKDDKSALKLRIEVQAENRLPLFEGTDDVKSVVRFLQNNKDKYNKAKVKAKGKNVKLREYNLYDEYFSYEIDVVNHKVVDQKKIYYTQEEMDSIYIDQIKMAYNENKTYINELFD